MTQQMLKIRLKNVHISRWRPNDEVNDIGICLPNNYPVHDHKRCLTKTWNLLIVQEFVESENRNERRWKKERMKSFLILNFQTIFSSFFSLSFELWLILFCCLSINIFCEMNVICILMHRSFLILYILCWAWECQWVCNNEKFNESTPSFHNFCICSSFIFVRLGFLCSFFYR